MVTWFLRRSLWRALARLFVAAASELLVERRRKP